MYPLPVGVDVRHLIDGGANIGLFSVWHSALPNLEDVILIEPDPKNLELLRQNARDEARFTIIPVALSDRTGEAYFEVAEANTGHLAGMPGHASSQGRFQVSCKRLADVVPAHWKMEHTWLKLDIEGAEYEVLGDAIASNIKPAAISLEIHEFSKAGGARLVEELERAGYQVNMLDPGSAQNTCRQITAVMGVSPSRPG